jgi:hypothetical protein
MADGRVHRLGVVRGRAVAAAIVRGAQLQAAPVEEVYCYLQYRIIYTEVCMATACYAILALWGYRKSAATERKLRNWATSEPRH